MAETPVVPAKQTDSFAQDHVPYVLRLSAAWAWRLIVVGIVVMAISMVISDLATVLLPMVIALLIAAPLERLVTRMQHIGIPRGLGAILSILLLLAFIVGMSAAAGAAIINGFEQLRDRAVAGFDELVDWLASGPLDLSRAQLDEGIDNATSAARENAWGLASGALSITGVVGGIFAGIIIALVALFFFLRDGRNMWLWIAGLAPGDEATARVDRAGSRAWTTLRRYTQTSVFVAFVDAVGIGAVAWILGVPLALPIAILTFLTAFIPLIGATLAGLVATLIALVDGGWTTALLMLAGILVVQQIEGNVLYPWLFGRAAAIHPFVILLTISAGTLTAGLVGAIIAVPILAFAYTFVQGLKAELGPDDDDEERPITAQIPIMARKGRDAVRTAMSKTSEIRVRKPRTGETPTADSTDDDAARE